MKSIRACTAYVDMDLPSLIWTRGRDFPIARAAPGFRVY
jgi:hypothetical protein